MASDKDSFSLTNGVLTANASHALVLESHTENQMWREMSVCHVRQRPSGSGLVQECQDATVARTLLSDLGCCDLGWIFKGPVGIIHGTSLNGWEVLALRNRRKKQ